MANINMPWLRPLWQEWAATRAQQGLPHAIGIPWQPDAGTEFLVDALIAWLLCHTTGNMACGNCKSCQLHVAGNHPDFLRIRPEENKKIGIDEIRRMHDRVWSRANQSGAKVVFIQSAEKMTEAAANALLKTLEEPPEHTYIIVAPERFSRLLPTIRSRIQAYALPQPTQLELQEWFAQHLGKEIDDHHLAIRAQYAPLKVLNLLKEGKQRDSLVEEILLHKKLEYPEKGGEAELWLDILLEDIHKCLIDAHREHRAEFASQLLSWYNRVLNIKHQAQLGGVNIVFLLEGLFTDMRLERAQSREVSQSSKGVV